MSPIIQSLSLYSVLCVALGGAFGASSRYLVTVLFHQWFKTATAMYSILVVNVLGSFVIGFVAIWLVNMAETKTDWLGMQAGPLKWFIVIGFLGSFTTVSSFSLESVYLLQSQEYIKALQNILLTVVLSISACGLGMLVYHRFS